MTLRRVVAVAAAALGMLVLLSAGAYASARPAQNSSVSKQEAIKQLDVVRSSIDETLALIKAGNEEQALAEAKDGYLSHFELERRPCAWRTTT